VDIVVPSKVRLATAHTEAAPKLHTAGIFLRKTQKSPSMGDGLLGWPSGVSRAAGYCVSLN